MSVAVDNTGQSAVALSTSALSISSFAVGGGANRCIYLAVAQYSNPDRVPSATFNTTENFVVHDQQTIAESPGTRRVTILKLVNPSNATAAIAVSWPGAVNEAIIGATSWTGVDQTTPFGTAVKTSGNTGTSTSVAIPNAVGDAVHSSISIDAGTDATPDLTANQTLRFRAVAAANTSEGAGQSAAGTGSNITCTWSTFGSGAGSTFAHVGVAILQAASGTASAPAPLLPTMAIAPYHGRIGPLAMVMRALRPPASGAPLVYTLPAGTGVYTLTGQSVGLAETHRVALGTGTYTLTGQSVNLSVQHRLPLANGSYSLSGQTVNLRRIYTLAAAAGSYALSGQSVTLRAARRLAVANGTYTLNGQAVALSVLTGGDFVLVAGLGSYVLNGQAVSLRAARRLAVATGLYTLSGSALAMGVVNLADIGEFLPSRGLVERRFGAIRTRNRPASVQVERGATLPSDTVSGEEWTPSDHSGAGLALTLIDEACRVVRTAGLAYAFFALVFPATGNTAPAAIGLPIIARDTGVPVAPVAFSYLTVADITGIVVNGASQFNLFHTDGSPVTNAALSGAVLRGCAIYEAAL